MAFWPYPPQEVLAETLTADARLGPVGPRAMTAGALTSDLVRGFRLTYGIVTSEDADGMARFFCARRGSYEAFQWVNPNDARVYLVRFDTSMRLEMFTPGLLRSGMIQFT